MLCVSLRRNDARAPRSRNKSHSGRRAARRRQIAACASAGQKVQRKALAACHQASLHRRRSDQEAAEREEQIDRWAGIDTIDSSGPERMEGVRQGDFGDSQCNRSCVHRWQRGSGRANRQGLRDLFAALTARLRGLLAAAATTRRGVERAAFGMRAVAASRESLRIWRWRSQS